MISTYINVDTKIVQKKTINANIKKAIREKSYQIYFYNCIKDGIDLSNQMI